MSEMTRLDGFVADGPLAGLFQAGRIFFTIEGNSRAVLLDDFQRRFFDFFIGGEAAIATEALATTADGELGIKRSRVDHARFTVSTKRAHHCVIPPL